MKKLYTLLLAAMILTALTACAGTSPEAGGVSQSDTSTTVPETTTAAAATTSAPETTVPAGDAAYLCRLNDNGGYDLVFRYAAGELAKVEYYAAIKGMPEEIEAREALTRYTGVTMSDANGFVLFEVDAAAGGLQYLRDTHKDFAGLGADLSWETICAHMAERGYTCTRLPQ